MTKLFVYPGKGEGFVFNLKGEKVSIGRLSDNDIPIDDAYSSGHHAVILPTQSGYAIRDNGSKNGTFLNDKKIMAETELKRGDEILIGSTRIIFDLELKTDVEVTEEQLPASNVQSVIQVKKILKTPDIETTLREFAAAPDIHKLRSDFKFFSVLSEVSQALILHKPIDELLEEIMDLICQNLPMDRGILMLEEGSPPQLVPRVVRIVNKNLKTQRIQVSRSIIDVVRDKNSSVLTYDAQADPRFQASESIIQSNIHSAMCVPLWNNKEIIGIIYADRISIMDRFSEDDLKLLTLLSNLAAVKIENARLIQKAIEKEKMERELALASQIQKDFLPKKNPECDNFDLAGMNLTCYQVGGDYYDFIDIDPCRMAIIIADVSGKGVSASLLMASLRAAIYADLNPEYKLESMASKLNDFVHRSSASNSFITFFFCELNKKNGEIRYINAGHNPPLILDKKGQVRRLESCGLCLGMFPSVNYEACQAELQIGDVAVFFTDGITESRNIKNEEFGEERLLNVLKNNSRLSAQKLIEKICAEVDEFSAGVEPDDDRTLVIIKRIA